MAAHLTDCQRLLLLLLYTFTGGTLSFIKRICLKPDPGVYGIKKINDP